MVNIIYADIQPSNINPDKKDARRAGADCLKTKKAEKRYEPSTKTKRIIPGIK